MDDTSSGSGSDDGRTRGNEWEVVTRSLSSHSLSASTSFEAGSSSSPWKISCSGLLLIENGWLMFVEPVNEHL